jgi:hypothetical protein
LVTDTTTVRSELIVEGNKQVKESRSKVKSKKKKGSQIPKKRQEVQSNTTTKSTVTPCEKNDPNTSEVSVKTSSSIGVQCSFGNDSLESAINVVQLRQINDSKLEMSASNVNIRNVAIEQKTESQNTIKLSPKVSFGFGVNAHGVKNDNNVGDNMEIEQKANKSEDVLAPNETRDNVVNKTTEITDRDEKENTNNAGPVDVANEQTETLEHASSRRRGCCLLVCKLCLPLQALLLLLLAFILFPAGDEYSCTFENTFEKSWNVMLRYKHGPPPY